MRRELDIRGSRLNNNQFPAVISWLAGKEIDPAAIISHVLPFAEAEEGLRLFAENPAAACKIVLTL
jgi:L-gulonate 5-dehydrogenase